MEDRDCCACELGDATPSGTKSGYKVTDGIYGHPKAREVSVEQLDYGYCVRVGCQIFAIESLDKVLTMLTTYLHEPDKLEQSWRDGTLKF